MTKKAIIPVEHREHIIYLITNSFNGKRYVGQTSVRLRKRWGDHLSKARTGGHSYLSSAIRKHGENSFTVEEICRVTGRTQANFLERHYITLYDTSNRTVGYNCTSGGNERFEFTRESLKKLSDSLKAKKRHLSPFQKEALRKANFGKKRPKHIVDKIAYANSRKDVTAELVSNLYLKHELNTFQIARILSASQCTVWSRLKRAGVTLREGKGAVLPQFREDIKDEEVVKMYVDEKLSTSKIARRLGTTHHTVARRLKSSGVQMRTRGQATSLTNAQRREGKPCQATRA